MELVKWYHGKGLGFGEDLDLNSTSIPCCVLLGEALQISVSQFYPEKCHGWCWGMKSLCEPWITLLVVYWLWEGCLEAVRSFPDSKGMEENPLHSCFFLQSRDGYASWTLKSLIMIHTKYWYILKHEKVLRSSNITHRPINHWS